MSLFSELKRRKVFRVGAAYLVVAWFLVQVAETILPLFGFDETPSRILVIILAIGLVPILILTWVYELAPEGLIRDSGESVRAGAATNNRFDRIIIVALVLAVALFATHTFIIDPAGDAARIQEAAQQARSGAFRDTFGDKSIAVLAFENISADPEQEFFSDGISEELINLLAKIEGLRVISRTSSFQFKGTDLRIPEIAEQLDVAHILEGSVRKSGNKIRITAQLIDAGADVHVWSETYDRDLKDVFAIQDDVAAKVVDALKVTMNVGLPTVARHNPEAYPLYMQGRHLLNLDDPDNFERAESLLLRAIELEPGYSDAQVNLSLLYQAMAFYEGHNGNHALSIQFFDQRDELLQAVEARDPDHVALNASLGWDAFGGGGRRGEARDYARAAKYFEKAIAADPRNYESLLVAMIMTDMLGRTDLAIRIGEYLTRRDPMGFWALANLAEAYGKKGQFDKTVAAYRTAATISPRAVAIQWKLGVALLMNGEPEKGLEHIERDEHPAYMWQGKALALHDLGDHEGSESAMQELHRIKDEAEVAPWYDGFSRAYAYLGKTDKAFEYLDKIQQSGIEDLFDIIENPYYSNLHDDPRWQSLVDEIQAERSKIEFNPKLPPEILAN